MILDLVWCRAELWDRLVGLAGDSPRASECKESPKRLEKEVEHRAPWCIQSMPLGSRIIIRCKRHIIL